MGESDRKDTCSARRRLLTDTAYAAGTLLGYHDAFNLIAKLLAARPRMRAADGDG